MAKLSTYEELGKKVAEEALDGYIYMGKTLRECIDTVKQIRWIPCSEQEPTESGNYLITWIYKWNNNITRYIDIAEYDLRYNKWWRTEKMLIYNNHTKIIAWMPLPEAYEESENK